MSLALGCIADDYTGATDVGAMLSRAGFAVQLTFGVPSEPIDSRGCDAMIIALKSRSIPAPDAVQQALEALESLRASGAERYFFKYCSTFDSTDQGNIGPVAEALADSLGAQRVVFCPAFPENGRAVYSGHLFVHGKLLNESGMENHPLNPMTDANLVRVLQRQATCSTGLLPYDALDGGLDETELALQGLQAEGCRLVIADAVSDKHLHTIAAATARDPFITGGSAIAQAIAEYELQCGWQSVAAACDVASLEGNCVVIAGSCSQATLRQVEAMQQYAPACCVDPLKVTSGGQTADGILQWAVEQLADGPALVFSSSPPDRVKTAHTELGAEQAGNIVEQTLAQVAVGLVEHGVRKIIVAGGETAGAVVRELGIRSVLIGPEIAPGVPWVQTTGEPRLALALKSGNFGADDFFKQAMELLK